MRKYVWGATFTPEERAQMGLPPVGSQDTVTPKGILKSHTCTVTLPDGTSLSVLYNRFGARSHRFEFAAPLCQRLWHMHGLVSSTLTIEAKAQELTVRAFRMAQREEQQQMRRRMMPGWSQTKPTPQLKGKTADACAGLYCACVKFTSGLLLPIGCLHDDPDRTCQEIAEGKYANVQLHGEQRLVLGLCCRWERRWVEPRFVALPEQCQKTKVADNHLTAVSTPEQESGEGVEEEAFEEDYSEEEDG